MLGKKPMSNRGFGDMTKFIIVPFAIVIGVVIFLEVIRAVFPTLSSTLANIASSGIPLLSDFSATDGLILLIFGALVFVAVIAIIFRLAKVGKTK